MWTRTIGRQFSFCHSHGCGQRFFSSQRLTYSSFGEPLKVVRKEGHHIEKTEPDEMIVKMLASPVNPADINMIQGTYPLKPESFPAVPGNEGVGVIVQVGTGDNPFRFKEGEWVIPEHPSLGTWAGYVVGKNKDFLPIPKIDLASAATISVNPPTAYRMLFDFEILKPGDTIIQNGGNSAVGQAVIQLCRIFGFKSISVVRNRPNYEELKEKLLALGDNNTTIITEEELRTIKKDVRAQLALNCVGGKSGTDILRVMEPGRTLVTYGGMSRQPVIVPTSHLIFNDIKLQGYWMSKWNKINSIDKRLAMYNTIAGFCKDEKFTAPVHKFLPLAKYREALENAMESYTDTKYILTFD